MPSIGAALRGFKNAGIVPAAAFPIYPATASILIPRRSTAHDSRRSLMKRRILPTLVAASVACLFLGQAYAAGVLAPDEDESDLVPTGKGWGQRAYPDHPNGN